MDYTILKSSFAVSVVRSRAGHRYFKMHVDTDTRYLKVSVHSYATIKEAVFFKYVFLNIPKKHSLLKVFFLNTVVFKYIIFCLKNLFALILFKSVSDLYNSNNLLSVFSQNSLKYL